MGIAYGRRPPTNGRLHWKTESAAYFWTDKKKLLKAMENICLFRLLNEMDAGGESFKGIKGGALPRAKTLARDWFNELKKARDILRQKGSGDFYSVGVISAENLSDIDA